MRLGTIAAAAAAALVAAAPANAKPGIEGAACVTTADAAKAAVALYGPGTSVAGRNRIAGLTTVLALEPFIAPGTRHRMVRSGGRFCDAEAGLNRVKGKKSGAALARAYARLAAAPYFDGTSVRSIRSAGNVHRIRTHARTNGVVADWVIVTDGSGIRSAEWVVTRFAVAPLVGAIEGLTARVGASERYLRDASNVLRADRGLPRAAADVPNLGPSYRAPDGFNVIVSAGDSGQGVDVDRLKDIRKMAGENLAEFYKWGFDADWAPPVIHALAANAPAALAAPKTGYVYVNGVNSLYCQACVYIADDFQVHILSHFDKALVALGFDYPGASEYDVLSNILGHEIFHNFQNRYVKPTSTERFTPGIYSEGTARMQETLHSYSKISYQPDSLVIGDNNSPLLEGNDCKSSFVTEGNYEGALAAGPFNPSNSYAACHFWMRFYGTFGGKALVKLVSEGAPLGATPDKGEDGEPVEPPDSEKVIRALERAIGAPFNRAQGAWMRALITGKKMSWGPLVAGTGPVLDWAPLLDRYTPSTLALGESTTATLADGGVMAVEITAAGRPTVSAGGSLILIRDRASGARMTYPKSGAKVRAPGKGEKVYVVAAQRAVDAVETTLTLNTP